MWELTRTFRDGYAISIKTTYHKEGWDRWTEETYNIVNEKYVKQLDHDYAQIEVLSAQTTHYYKIKVISKFGLLSSDLQVLLPVEYSDIEVLSTQSTHYCKIRVNSKVGLLSSSMQELFPVEYSDIDVDFVNGIIRTIKKNEKSGSILVEYIDSKGLLLRSIVVDADLLDDDRSLKEFFPLFYESYCIVMLRGHSGILNLDGSYIIPPVYDELEIINDNIILASLNSKYGLISFNESILMDFVFDRIEYIEDHYFIVVKGNKEGILNILYPKKLKLKAIKYGSFSEGSILVCKEDENSEDKFGLENFNGEEIVPIVYDYLSNFNNGIAIAKIKDKQGLINNKNQFIQHLKFDSLTKMDKGYFTTKIKNKFGILNPDGSELVRPIYSKIEFLNNCFIVWKNGEYNYLQFNGQFDNDDWTQPYDDSYTQKEINDMYRDAFDGVADAEWNVD